MQHYFKFIIESRFCSCILEFEHGDISFSDAKFNIVTFQK